MADRGPASRTLWSRLRAHPVPVWLVRTVNAFLNDHCLVRASALTYATLLALVPLLAVVLAILKGAGFGSNLRPFLLERLPVVDPVVIDQILEYIGRANAQAVGGIGFAALLFACWTLLGNIEGALNHIFCVRRFRGYLRRTGEYLSMILVGAVMVVLSVVLQTVLGSSVLFERFLGSMAGDLTRLTIALLPWLSIWAGLTFLYTWMPNARVPARTAFMGALLGGSLFQLVQLGYIELQFGFARYNAIYGALAQLPFLLVWIYLSWSVILLGAEAAAQYRTFGVPSDALRLVSSDGFAPTTLALVVLREVGDAFRKGVSTPGAVELAGRLGVDARALRAAVAPLIKGGILVEPEEPQGYLPAVALGALPLERVLAALADGGSGEGTR